MPKAELDLVGHLLMTQVRDSAVLDWKRIVDGTMKGGHAAKQRKILAAFSGEQRKAFLSLVPEVVDTVLHHLLWTLEQQRDVVLHVRAGGGEFQDLKEISDGLPGELYTEDGWVARFSKEKV